MAEARAVPVWQTRLRADGQRRLTHGAILFVWCAVGLIVLKWGLDALVAVLQVLFDPAPMGLRSDMRNVQAVGLVSGALALIVFLTGWSWVGFRFARFLLPSLWFEDQVFVDSKGVTWRRWFGPGSALRYLPFTEVAAVLPPIGGVDVLLHSGRKVRLASLGSSAEQQSLHGTLRVLSELETTPREPEQSVPEGMEALALSEGATVLRQPRQDERGRAWFRGGVALLLAGAAAMGVWRQHIDGLTVEDTLCTAVLGALALWAGVSALPGFQSRWEWEVRFHTLDRVMYGMGRSLRERHRVKSLELRRAELSDGDGGTQQEFTLWMLTAQGERVVDRSGWDSHRLTHLGKWLAARLDVPFKRRRDET